MNNMKRTISILLSIAALAAASSCTFVRFNDKAFSSAKGDVVKASSESSTNTYTVPQFTGIEAHIAADIIYNMTGGDPTVTVEAPENYLEHLVFDVEDGVLKVEFDDNRKYSSSSKIRITASSATLESLTISGAGDFKSLAGIDAESMKVVIIGAGDVDIDGLRCTGDVEVSVSGAGDIDMRGLSCRNAKVVVTGAGDVDLAGKADSADLSIAGAGDIDIRELDVENVSSSVAGVGKIRRK